MATPKKGNYYWRYTHFSLNHQYRMKPIPSPPTQPQTQKQLFVTKVSISIGFWQVIFHNERKLLYFLAKEKTRKQFLERNLWEELFTSLTINWCLIRPGKVGKKLPIFSSLEWSLGSPIYFFCGFLGVQRNVLPSKTMFFWTKNPNFSVDVIKSKGFYLHPNLWFSQQKPTKKTVAFLPRLPPLNAGPILGGSKQAAHIW